MTLIQFLDMNGYGIYVWPAYCITLFVFGINFFITLVEKRQVKKILAQYLKHADHHES